MVSYLRIRWGRADEFQMSDLATHIYAYVVGREEGNGTSSHNLSRQNILKIESHHMSCLD